MKYKMRFIVWTIIIIFILTISITMLLIDSSQGNEIIAYNIILLIIGGIYELWQWLKTHNKIYRFAWGIGLAGIFILAWANGAIGIIGSENNPANLLFGTIPIVIIIGGIVSLFKPRGMSYTLFLAAFIQIIIPIFALLVRPAQASWGDAGVIGVIIFNSIFSLIFVISGVLFYFSSSQKNGNNLK